MAHYRLEPTDAPRNMKFKLLLKCPRMTRSRTWVIPVKSVQNCDNFGLQVGLTKLRNSSTTSSTLAPSPSVLSFQRMRHTGHSCRHSHGCQGACNREEKADKLTMISLGQLKSVPGKHVASTSNTRRTSYGCLTRSGAGVELGGK